MNKFSLGGFAPQLIFYYPIGFFFSEIVYELFRESQAQRKVRPACGRECFAKEVGFVTTTQSILPDV